MNDAILAAIITGCFALLGAVIAAIISAKVTSDKTIQKLESSQAVTANEINYIKDSMAEMKADLKSHNHYAQLFNENIPVIKEKLGVEEHRVKDLEDEVKSLRNNRE